MNSSRSVVRIGIVFPSFLQNRVKWIIIKIRPKYENGSHEKKNAFPDVF